MEKCYNLILIAAFLMCLVQPAVSLKCVQCGPTLSNVFDLVGDTMKTLTGEMSGEDLKKKFTATTNIECTKEWPKPTDCAGSEQYCVKYELEGDKGEKHASRSCSSSKEEGCKEKTKLCAYSCTTDGCNGAPPSVSANQCNLFLAVAFVAMLLAKF